MKRRVFGTLMLLISILLTSVPAFSVQAQQDVQPCFQFRNTATGELIPVSAVDYTFYGTDHSTVMTDPVAIDDTTVCYRAGTPHTLSPGNYRVAATAEGYQPYDTEWGVWETTTYVVPMTPLAPVEPDPEPTTHTVTFSVREQDGSIPVGASVEFDGVQYPLNENGQVVFPGMADGNYIFNVIYYNYPWQRMQVNVTVAGDDVWRDVVLPYPTPNLAWSYTCPEMSGVGVGDTVTVGYTVTEMDGRAEVTNATVSVLRAGASVISQSSTVIPAGGSISGELSIPITQTDLDRGYVQVNTELSGTRPGGRATFSTGRSMNCAITPAPVQNDGTVIVVDADGVTPISEATVTLGNLTGTTDATGSAIFPDLADGTYPVTVTAPDGRTATGELVIAGASNSVTVQLPAAAPSIVLTLGCPEIPYGTRVGDTVTFTVTVQNTGNVTLTELGGLATSPWGAGARTYNPPLPESLAPGATFETTFTMPIETNATLQNRFSGNVSAYGYAPSGLRVADSESLRSCTWLAVEDFEISATCPDIPTDVAAGDTVVIPVVVTSRGDRNITSPVFTADREGTIARIVTLGREPTVVNRTFTTTVTEADMEAGVLNANITLTAPNAARGEFSHTATVACRLVPEPSPTATAVPSPTATAEPSPTATTVPSPTATTIPSPTATTVPDPTATTEPTATTPGATATPSPEQTATPTVQPSTTAAPTTPPSDPTATAAPQKVSGLPSTGSGTHNESLALLALSVMGIGLISLGLRKQRVRS